MTLATMYPRSVERSFTHVGRAGQFGATITAGTAIHTLSADYTTIITATQHDTFWTRVMLRSTFQAGIRTDMLMNIYIGASGSEQILIPNLLAGWAANSSPRVYQFPLFIPSGSRLSAKAQAAISADTVVTWLALEGGGRYPNWAGRAVECLGADTSGSFGASVLMGTTSEGSFTSIGTTTTEWGYITPMLQGTLADVSMVTQHIDLDIGSGGAQLGGLEGFVFQASSSEYTFPLGNGVGAYYKIPSGTPIQFRLQGSSATGETLDACAYGVY